MSQRRGTRVGPSQPLVCDRRLQQHHLVWWSHPSRIAGAGDIRGERDREARGGGARPRDPGAAQPMSRHRDVVVAFAVGATIGALGAFELWPPAVRVALFLLSPGTFVGAPFAQFVLFGGYEFALFTIGTLAAVANGFTYATMAFLFRIGSET